MAENAELPKNLPEPVERAVKGVIKSVAERTAAQWVAEEIVQAVKDGKITVDHKGEPVGKEAADWVAARQAEHTAKIQPKITAFAVKLLATSRPEEVVTSLGRGSDVDEKKINALKAEAATAMRKKGAAMRSLAKIEDWVDVDSNRNGQVSINEVIDYTQDAANSLSQLQRDALNKARELLKTSGVKTTQSEKEAKPETVQDIQKLGGHSIFLDDGKVEPAQGAPLPAQAKPRPTAKTIP